MNKWDRFDNILRTLGKNFRKTDDTVINMCFSVYASQKYSFCMSISSTCSANIAIKPIIFGLN